MWYAITVGGWRDPERRGCFLAAVHLPAVIQHVDAPGYGDDA